MITGYITARNNSRINKLSNIPVTQVFIGFIYLFVFVYFFFLFVSVSDQNDHTKNYIDLKSGTHIHIELTENQFFLLVLIFCPKKYSASS